MSPAEAIQQARQPLVTIPLGTLLGVMGTLGVLQIRDDRPKQIEPKQPEVKMATDESVKNLANRIDGFFSLYAQTDAKVDTLIERSSRHETKIDRNTDDIKELRQAINRWNNPFPEASP